MGYSLERNWVTTTCLLQLSFQIGNIMEDDVFTPMQCEILRAVFRSMDRELGIRPLTEEQIKAFNLKLDEVADEANKQI